MTHLIAWASDLGLDLIPHTAQSMWSKIERLHGASSLSNRRFQQSRSGLTLVQRFTNKHLFFMKVLANLIPHTPSDDAEKSQVDRRLVKVIMTGSVWDEVGNPQLFVKKPISSHQEVMISESPENERYATSVGCNYDVSDFSPYRLPAGVQEIHSLIVVLFRRE